MEKEQFIEKACTAYCKLCDTKECEEFGESDYNCDWVQKFRKQLKRELK